MNNVVLLLNETHTAIPQWSAVHEPCGQSQSNLHRTRLSEALPVCPVLPSGQVFRARVLSRPLLVHPPIVQIYHPISVSEAAAPHKNDGMQSRSVFNNYYQTVTRASTQQLIVQ